MLPTATPAPTGTPSPPKQLPVPCRQPPRPSSYGQTVGGSATDRPRFSLASALLLGATATPAYAMPTASPYAPPPSSRFSGAGRWSNALPPPPYPPPPPPTGRPALNATNTTAGRRPISGTQRGKRGKERTYSLTQLQAALYALAAASTCLAHVHPPRTRARAQTVT